MESRAYAIASGAGVNTFLHGQDRTAPPFFHWMLRSVPVGRWVPVCRLPTSGHIRPCLCSEPHAMHPEV